MRLTELEICNIAIGMCGSTDFIQTLTDNNSVSARRCSRFFNSAVEKVLRKHDWNCATALAELAENTTPPAFEYEHSFALPVGCARVINAYEDPDEYSPYDQWRVVGRNIHTDMETVYLKYIHVPEDHRELDILLSDVIAGELALMLAPTLVKDKEVYSILFQAVQQKFHEAKAIDTLENKYVYTENSVWNDARIIGG